MTDGLIYLASPYSHADPAVMQARFEQVCAVASRLMRLGIYLYSPIAHTHPIAVHGGLPRGWDFWEEFDRKILAACSELWICTMDGWRASEGVAAETLLALDLDLPVSYVDPVTLVVTAASTRTAKSGA